MIRRVRPRLINIVDFEASIRRDEIRLNGGDVYARHLGGWMVISEVTAPGLALNILNREKVKRNPLSYITHAPVPQPTSRTR